MRMAGPDVVLFVVGALMFGGAVFALWQEGGSTALAGGSPTGVYSVEYVLGQAEAERQAVADYSAATATFAVTTLNVSRMIVTIECADALPGGTFNLQVTVEPPAGLDADPKAGACGSPIEIEVPVAKKPDATSAHGATPAEAERGLAMDAAASRAVGDWTVTVAGARGASPVGLPAGNPGGAIVLVAETWTPKLTPVVK